MTPHPESPRPTALRGLIEHLVAAGQTDAKAAEAVRLAAEEQRDTALAALVDAAHRLAEAGPIASADPKVVEAMNEAAQCIVRIAITPGGVIVSMAGLAADGATGTEVLRATLDNGAAV